MSNCIPPARYTAYPELKSAIAAHRAARITVSLKPSEANLTALKRARVAERRMRALFADRVRADKESAALAAIQARRRHAASRTLDAGHVLRDQRAQRRAEARTAALAKREANLARKLPSDH